MQKKKQKNFEFELESFKVYIEKKKDCPCSTHATIKISSNGTKEITAAEGHGPIDALNNALRKALKKLFPTNLDFMRLADFKVETDGEQGTSSEIKVIMKSCDENYTWHSSGVSRDIIEASWQALADSFQYKLSKEKQKE